jgi:hypothetical protein
MKEQIEQIKITLFEAISRGEFTEVEYKKEYLKISVNGVYLAFYVSRFIDVLAMYSNNSDISFKITEFDFSKINEPIREAYNKHHNAEIEKQIEELKKQLI